MEASCTCMPSVAMPSRCNAGTQRTHAVMMCNLYRKRRQLCDVPFANGAIGASAKPLINTAPVELMQAWQGAQCLSKGEGLDTDHALAIITVNDATSFTGVVGTILAYVAARSILVYVVDCVMLYR